MVVLLYLVQVATRSIKEKKHNKKKRKQRKKTQNFPRPGKESGKSEKMEENQQPSKKLIYMGPAR